MVPLGGRERNRKKGRGRVEDAGKAETRDEKRDVKDVFQISDFVPRLRTCGVRAFSKKIR
jgi:hypothetical protein